MDEFTCWRCGAALESISRPYVRIAECPTCRADLYVCKMCANYNPRMLDQCDEPTAEDVREKERANFCDFFEAKPNVFKKPQSAASSQAMEKLQELFGIKAAVETKPLTNDDVESLFSKPKPKKTKDKKK